MEVNCSECKSAVCSFLRKGVHVLADDDDDAMQCLGVRGTYSKERSCAVRVSTAARAWWANNSESILFVSFRFVSRGPIEVLAGAEATEDLLGRFNC